MAVPASTRLARLTGRELDVLASIAEGLSNEAIARRAHISVKTLEAISTSMFRKLELTDSPDANRRVLAVLLYLEHTAELQRASAVPARLTSFIGRHRELDDLGVLLRSARLVTVIGAGGSGKTSLALAFAGRSLDRSEQVKFVQLDSVRTPSGVVAAVLGAFDIAETDAAKGFRDLRSRFDTASIVLVIDNAEHVTRAVVSCIDELAAMPQLRILVTSRRPLQRRDEHIYAIPPLRDDEAADLVRSRARVPLDDAAIDSISAAADGLPLALELVAAQISVVGSERLTEQLEHIHHVTVGDQHDRHRSVAAALASSYVIVSPPSRTVLRALSVAVGGCNADLAKATAGSPAGFEASLDELATSSLVAVERGRYRMVEPVRQYAAELLDEASETDEAGLRFIHGVIELVSRANAEAYTNPDRARSTLSAERTNIRHAIELALDGDHLDEALRILHRLGTYWSSTDTPNGVVLSRQVLAASARRPHDHLYGRALATTANLESLLSPDGDWPQKFVTAIQTLEACGDRRGLALALFNKARVLADEAAYAAAIDVAAELDDPTLLTWSLLNRATLLVQTGRADREPIEMIDRAIDLARQHELPTVLATALMRKVSAQQHGYHPTAATTTDTPFEQLLTEATMLVNDNGGQWLRIELLLLQARTHLLARRDDAAAPLLTEALDLAVGARSGPLLAEVISLAASRARLAGDEDAVARLLELAGGVIGTPYPGERARVTANWHTSWHPWHHNRIHQPPGQHTTQARHLAHLDNVRRAAVEIIAAPPRPPTETRSPTNEAGEHDRP